MRWHGRSRWRGVAATRRAGRGGQGRAARRQHRAEPAGEEQVASRDVIVLLREDRNGPGRNAVEPRILETSMYERHDPVLRAEPEKVAPVELPREAGGGLLARQ